MRIVDPTQGREDNGGRGLVSTDARRLGGQVCLLSNSKPNASELLTRVAARFGELRGAPLFVKPASSRPAPAELLDRIAESFDAALVALCD